jgi:hypothetical protein
MNNSELSQKIRLVRLSRTITYRTLFIINIDETFPGVATDSLEVVCLTVFLLLQRIQLSTADTDSGRGVEVALDSIESFCRRFCAMDSNTVFYVLPSICYTALHSPLTSIIDAPICGGQHEWR